MIDSMVAAINSEAIKLLGREIASSLHEKRRINFWKSQKPQDGWMQVSSWRFMKLRRERWGGGQVW